MITREDIKTLQEEAILAGDYLQDGICRIALSDGGEDTYAWYVCEQAILNGRG